MSDPATDEIMRKIASPLSRELLNISDGIVEDVRKAISVPVQILNPLTSRKRDNPFGKRAGIKHGGNVIRSKPGEPPRRETGRLFTSITPTVKVDGDTFILKVESNTPYDARLEYKMNRPFMRPAEKRWATLIPPRLTSAINK
jgi:hypothetical protein